MKKPITIFCLAALLVLTGCSQLGVTGTAAPTAQENKAEALGNEANGSAETAAESDTPAHTENATTRAAQGGPYGEVSIELPEEWEAECISIDYSDTIDGLYGIRVYNPSIGDPGVYVSYHQNFGVCGTGLATEEIDLAGATATVGCYDADEYWNFVIFKGPNEGVVALPCIFEENREAYEDFFAILDTVRFDPERKSGGAYYYSEESELLDMGLQMSLKNLSDGGATVVFSQWNPDAVEELYFGQEFSMQVQNESGGWEELAPIIDNGAFTMEAIAIVPGEMTEFDMKWDWLYGELEPGTYRITKNISDMLKDGTSTSGSIGACFVWSGAAEDEK